MSVLETIEEEEDPHPSLLHLEEQRCLWLALINTIKEEEEKKGIARTIRNIIERKARTLEIITSLVQEQQKERTMHRNELHRLQTDLELSQEEAAALKEVNSKLSQEVHHFKCKLWERRREIKTLEHGLKKASQNNELQYKEAELWKWIKLA